MKDHAARNAPYSYVDITCASTTVLPSDVSTVTACPMACGFTDALKAFATPRLT
jgi:hypothetical protein